MWMVEELSQIVKEMLLEGNIHNIVVFTVITSSSVLSVVGVLRHIYTFIHNLRHVQEVNPPPAKDLYNKTGDPYSRTFMNLDFSSDASFDRLDAIHFDNMIHDTQNRQLLKGVDFPGARNSYCLTCVKCGKTMGDRHSVYGLCKDCCQRLRGCKEHGYVKRLMAYDPIPASWHKRNRIVNLSHKGLKELPPRLGFNYMDAYSLDASFNNLTYLPEHVTLMRHLASIRLSHNLLSNIPAFCASLRKLTYVDLRNNKLCTFPDSLLELSQLQDLYLDHNSLSKLPYSIDRLHFLECLSLGHNDLTSIPDSLFKIRCLQSLNLRGNNKLTILPGGIGKLICLEKLDVSYCALQFIPPSLSSCTILTKCNVSFNRLVHFPCDISQCYRLEQVDISNNRLAYLPATLLFRQRFLTLKADGNCFMQKKNLKSRYKFLDTVTPQGGRYFPTLTSLSGDIVNKYYLDISELPVSVQEKLCSKSSCYHCGKKNVMDSFRAISFTYFAQDSLQEPHRDHEQEYPFLYTFCQCHVQKCTDETLEACIDSLSGT